MLPAGVRTLADAAAAEAASRAFLAVCSSVGSGSGMLEARVPAAVRARRAAYALLLASTLAPRPFRATNLPLAASLFRAATLRDPALSNEAARAALAVEALLHPAAPPLHPRAIAPPSDRGLEEPRGFGIGGFGNDGFERGGVPVGGASWGVVGAAARDAPKWGEADDRAPIRARAAESEEEEEEEEEEETEEAEKSENVEAVDGDTATDGALVPPTRASPEASADASRGDAEPKKAAKRESSPPASPRGAKKAKAEAEAKQTDAPARSKPRGRRAEPEARPKRQTAKEKSAAAKAAKAAEEAKAAEAAAATSKPKSGYGLGLGSGKSPVALALSDSDSDGELPEIVDA